MQNVGLESKLYAPRDDNEDKQEEQKRIQESYAMYDVKPDYTLELKDLRVL